MTTKTKSQTNDWSIQGIRIRDLTLWDENSRIPDYLMDGDQIALIQLLLRKYDLENLAKAIIQDQDIPQLERIVVWNDGDHLIVLEGNRRLAAYKCIMEPSLIEDSHQRVRFEEMRKRASFDTSFKLEALITTSKEQGMRFIERKHYYGNNEKRWEQYERDHHIRRTREDTEEGLSKREKDSIFRANIADKVKLVGLPDEVKRAVLGKGYATTFYRVVGGNEGKKRLKYERLDYDLRVDNEAEFLNLLKVIIYNIVNKARLDGRKLNSRTLNEDTAIRDYLESIQPGDVAAVDAQISSSAQRSEAKADRKKAKKPKGKARGDRGGWTSLIDPSLELPRKAPGKVRTVFGELQKISVSECPTATSILVRILIEISVDGYMGKKGVTPGKNDSLHEKITYVKNNFVTNSDLKTTIDLLNNELLTKKLNQVAHNSVFEATETTIKDLWKNLFSFFKFLVPNIKART